MIFWPIFILAIWKHCSWTTINERCVKSFFISLKLPTKQFKYPSTPLTWISFNMPWLSPFWLQWLSPKLMLALCVKDNRKFFIVNKQHKKSQQTTENITVMNQKTNRNIFCSVANCWWGAGLELAVESNEYKKCLIGLKAYRCYANLSASCIRYYRKNMGDDAFDEVLERSRLSNSSCAAKK